MAKFTIESRLGHDIPFDCVLLCWSYVCGLLEGGESQRTWKLEGSRAYQPPKLGLF